MTTRDLLEALMVDIPLDSWEGDRLLREIIDGVQAGKTVHLWVNGSPTEVRLSKGKIEVTPTERARRVDK